MQRESEEKDTKKATRKKTTKIQKEWRSQFQTRWQDQVQQAVMGWQPFLIKVMQAKSEQEKNDTGMQEHKDRHTSLILARRHDGQEMCWKLWRGIVYKNQKFGSIQLRFLGDWWMAGGRNWLLCVGGYVGWSCADVLEKLFAIVMVCVFRESEISKLVCVCVCVLFAEMCYATMLSHSWDVLAPKDTSRSRCQQKPLYFGCYLVGGSVNGSPPQKTEPLLGATTDKNLLGRPWVGSRGGSRPEWNEKDLCKLWGSDSK